ncbi:hypothetical protein BASA62_002634 [Batrachochytrium salamandrivorans]|nr:hypothetical protein BASA62_002634 [Batrachochytrium salamandrivorans]
MERLLPLNKGSPQTHTLSLPCLRLATTLGTVQITLLARLQGKRSQEQSVASVAFQLIHHSLRFGTPGFTFSGLSESVDSTTPVNVGLDVALDTEPELISSTCLSRAGRCCKISSSHSKGVNDTTKTSMESLEGTWTVKGSLSFYHKVRKVFCCLSQFVSDEGLEFSGATIRSFTVSAA